VQDITAAADFTRTQEREVGRQTDFLAAFRRVLAERLVEATGGFRGPVRPKQRMLSVELDRREAAR
jgi:hypothetical protein